jgi:hypothetical protein
MNKDMWKINRIFAGIFVGITFIAMVCSLYKKIKGK